MNNLKGRWKDKTFYAKAVKINENVEIYEFYINDELDRIYTFDVLNKKTLATNMHDFYGNRKFRQYVIDDNSHKFLFIKLAKAIVKKEKELGYRK